MGWEGPWEQVLRVKVGTCRGGSLVYNNASCSASVARTLRPANVSMEAVPAMTSARVASWVAGRGMMVGMRMYTSYIQ